jgi:hypothetical protein
MSNKRNCDELDEDNHRREHKKPNTAENSIMDDSTYYPSSSSSTEQQQQQIPYSFTFQQLSTPMDTYIMCMVKTLMSMRFPSVDSTPSISDEGFRSIAKQYKEWTEETKGTI